MGDKDKTVSPRINLAPSLSKTPVAAKIDVKFDYHRPNKVRLGDHKDISVNRGLQKILFDLKQKDRIPGSPQVSIKGIEFDPATYNRGFPPEVIFDNPFEFKDQKGNHHTVYGRWAENQHELDLLDDNWPDGEQFYGYKVWVEVDFGARQEYFSTEDPTIKNKPTT